MTRTVVKITLEASVYAGHHTFIYMHGQLLCRYRKRTDIYYSMWSFENVAKICQFQFLDPPPPHTKNLGGYKKMSIFFANVHVIKRRQLTFHGICQFQFLDPPHTHTKIFWGV